MRKKFSIEPDDGYSEERDNHPRKTWEQWEAERDEYLARTHPGLMEYIDTFQQEPVEEVVKPEEVK